MYNLGGFPPGWPPCPGWFHHAFLYKAGYTRPGSTRTLPRAGLQALAGYTTPHLGWLNHACSRRSLPRAGSTMPWRVRLVPRPITLPLWCYTQAVSSACTCKGISSQRMASPSGFDSRRGKSVVCTCGSLSTIALIMAGTTCL